MKILVVEKDENIAFLYEEEFRELGHKVISLNRGEKILEIIEKESPQVLILSGRISSYGPFNLLERVKAIYPKLPVIFNANLFEFWEDAKIKGADYYNEKSSDLTDLKKIIENIEKSRG